MFNLDESLFELKLTKKQKKDLCYCLLESYNEGKVVLCKDKKVNDIINWYCSHNLFIDPWTFETWGI